jgi:1-phosphofructokinase
MVLTVTLNPSIDRALFVDSLRVGDANRVLRSETDAGGKGINLSRVLHQLGGDTIATGFLAGGPGAAIRKVLDDQGVFHSFLDVDGESRTNVSIETQDSSLPTTLNERGPQVRPEDLELLFAHVVSHLSHARWVTLGGSLPPGVPPELTARFIEVGRQAQVRTMVDADGDPMRFAMATRPDFIKPNEREAGRILGRELSGRNDAIDAAVELYQQLGTGDKIVVVSRGAGGAILACNEGQFEGTTPAVAVKSTVGCGDSMLGGMLWALNQSFPVAEAFAWGLAAGAATAATDGTCIGSNEEIRRLFPIAKVERV